MYQIHERMTKPLSIPFENLRRICIECGADDFGVSRARVLDAEADFFEKWLAKGLHGSMHFLERNVDARRDVGNSGMLEGAKSVVTVLKCTGGFDSQTKAEKQTITLWDAVATYARRLDYHVFMKNMLHKILDRLKEEVSGVRARVLVDSAPVLERAWAVRAGLGFTGYNTCFIHTALGSAVVLGEIMLDIDVTEAADGTKTPAGQYSRDYCADCGLCINACPTGALIEPGVLDAGRCISYLLGEYDGDIEPGLKKLMGVRVFGCDACQAVCPANEVECRQDPDWETGPADEWKAIRLEDLSAFSDREIARVVEQTPLERLGIKRLRRNIDIALSNMNV